MGSLWRCTTSLSPRRPPETTWASTSRTSPSRTSSVDTSPLTPKNSRPRESPTSPPRSSCSTTPDKYPTDTLPCWIATPLTSPASSPRSWRRLTVVPASPLRMHPSSSSPETLPSSSWCPPSPCASSLSSTSPHSDVSPSVSSRPPLPRRSLVRPQRPPTRLARRSEILSRGNLEFYHQHLHMGKICQ